MTDTARGTVGDVTLFSFPCFSTTVPLLSIYKEPDGTGRYMKVLKPHLRLRIKTPFQFSGMAGGSQKGGKKCLSQHSTLDQPGIALVAGTLPPGLLAVHTDPFSSQTWPETLLKRTFLISRLKGEWKSFQRLGKKLESWRPLCASTTTEGHCAWALKQFTGRSGRLEFDRDVCRLGERAGGNRFAENSRAGEARECPLPRYHGDTPCPSPSRGPCYWTRL